MNTTPESLVFSRREFSQLILAFATLFGFAGTSRAGLDSQVKTRGRRKRIAGMATLDDAAAVKLRIDFPSDDGWRVIHRLHADEWRRIALDPDNLSPAVLRQLVAAKAAEWKTPVLARVYGDPVAIFDKALYFEPGEPDDRGTDDSDISCWRIEWFGDGIRRIAPDDSSWWQHRIEPSIPDEFAYRERAFAAQWKHENVDRPGINYGCGLAQDLMLSTHRYENPDGFEPWLTNRERRILATFVQWLGTNCGQGFLWEVERRMKETYPHGQTKGLMR